MNRHFWRAAALVVAIAFQGQVAHAQTYNNSILGWLYGNQDPRLTYTGIGLGIGAAVTSYELTKKRGIPPTRPMTPLAAYGVTSFGCIVVYPIVGTIWLGRSLTVREAWTGMANCVLPFIGGWWVEAAFRGQAWYEQGSPHAVVVRRHHHK